MGPLHEPIWKRALRKGCLAGGAPMAALAGGLPLVRPLPRLLGCWLPGVATMGSKCLALQWGSVGRCSRVNLAEAVWEALKVSRGVGIIW